MAIRALTTEGAKRLMELMKSDYRPSEILELQQQIKSATETATKRCEKSGIAEQELIENIVVMKRRLDLLVMDWAEGRIE